jgi:hypothetical protein
MTAYTLPPITAAQAADIIRQLRDFDPALPGLAMTAVDEGVSAAAKMEELMIPANSRMGRAFVFAWEYYAQQEGVKS